MHIQSLAVNQLTISKKGKKINIYKKVILSLVLFKTADATQKAAQSRLEAAY